MGLSDDQRAMLRLLAQRGEEGYDDVAALMGLSVEEVRAKVAEALAVLAEEGALAPQAGVGEPSPPAPEPAPAAVTPTPEPATTTKSAPEPAPAPPKAAKPRKTQTRPKISLPSGNGPRAAIAAAALVLVAVVVVLILSGGGASDSSTTSASNTTSGEGSTAGEQQATPTSNNAEVTKAVLKPVSGESGAGVAIFGRVKNSLALQLVAKGLQPTSSGTEYTVWLAQSPQRMLPLASAVVKADGRIGAQFKVPTEVLAYLANGTFDQLVLTRTVNSELEAALAEATKEERAPDYTGTEVLHGTVVGPIVGAAKRLEEEKEAEKGE